MARDLENRRPIGDTVDSLDVAEFLRQFESGPDADGLVQLEAPVEDLVEPVEQEASVLKEFEPAAAHVGRPVDTRITRSIPAPDADFTPKLSTEHGGPFRVSELDGDSELEEEDSTARRMAGWLVGNSGPAGVGIGAGMVIAFVAIFALTASGGMSDIAKVAEALNPVSLGAESSSSGSTASGGRSEFSRTQTGSAGAAGPEESSDEPADSDLSSVVADLAPEDGDDSVDEPGEVEDETAPEPDDLTASANLETITDAEGNIESPEARLVPVGVSPTTTTPTASDDDLLTRSLFPMAPPVTVPTTTSTIADDPDQPIAASPTTTAGAASTTAGAVTSSSTSSTVAFTTTAAPTTVAPTTAAPATSTTAAPALPVSPPVTSPTTTAAPTTAAPTTAAPTTAAPTTAAPTTAAPTTAAPTTAAPTTAAPTTAAPTTAAPTTSTTVTSTTSTTVASTTTASTTTTTEAATTTESTTTTTESTSTTSSTSSTLPGGGPPITVPTTTTDTTVPATTDPVAVLPPVACQVWTSASDRTPGVAVTSDGAPPPFLVLLDGDDSQLLRAAVPPGIEGNEVFLSAGEFNFPAVEVAAVASATEDDQSDPTVCAIDPPGSTSTPEQPTDPDDEGTTTDDGVQ